MVDTQKSIVIMLWNSNGLMNHVDELTQFLRDRRIDIGLITETHLKETTYCYIPGYSLYRCSHPDNRCHAGSAVLVRQGLKHCPLPTYCKTYIQSSSVEIFTRMGRLTLSSVYCPPNFNITPIQFKHFFSSLGRNFLAGGDFNSKHQQFGCRVTNPRGSSLYDVITCDKYFYYAPTDPTYYPSDERRLPDILDFFLSSKFLPYMSIEATPDLSSDHCPVIMTICSQPLVIKYRQSLPTRNVDWHKFRDILSNNTNLNVLLKTPTDIENTIEQFNILVHNAASESSSRYEHTAYRYPNIPTYIRELIVAKRRCRQRWQRERLPHMKTQLNRLSRRLKAVLVQYRNDRFMNFTENLTTKDKPLWHTARRLLRYSTPPFCLKKPTGEWAKTDTEKAELFAQHLYETFQPHDMHHPSHPDIESFLESPLPLSLPPKHASPNEIVQLIQALPSGKAPGYDLITSTFLRNLPLKSILLLTYIFNAILRVCHFPIQWKFSIIVLFHKPDKPIHQTSSYRPISLLPLLSKVFEKFLLSRLQPYINETNSIPKYQFGFRSAHSTLQQCHRIVDEISHAFERGYYCSGVFLDVAQAFDRVWHTGLLFKLKQILPDSLFLILQSYMKERFFKVRHGDELSALFPINAGVPQGSVLGPTLFSISIGDIPTSPNTLLALFADDMAILSSHVDPVMASLNIQNHIHMIEPWTATWKIKINETKSQHITFTLRKRDCPTVLVNNTALIHATTVRYLGLHLDRRLTWAHHISKTRSRMKTRFYQLKRLLDRRSKLRMTHKLTLYKTIIRPIWTYGVQLWGSAKPSHTKRIQAIQNKILRTITQCPFYVTNNTLHNDLHIQFVNDIARTSYTTLKTKFHNHTNPLIQQMSTDFIPGNPARRLKRRWPRDLSA